MTPLFYYCRLHYEDRNARRLRELEIAGIRSAMERSAAAAALVATIGAGSGGDEQSRAVRRKYIEERRARLLQLMAPVSMVRTGICFTNSWKERERDESIESGTFLILYHPFFFF